MDEKPLKRRDTTRGPPLRILSLDGGGVRGYSMLVILQELMHKVFSETEGRAPRRDEIPKPCEYFDLIGGTGTGGLIAIMLGRLRMDLETCKDVYIRMTRKVFETDKTLFGMPYRSSLFKASKLEEAIKECVRERTIYLAEGNDGTPEGGREGPKHQDGHKMTDIERRQSISSSMSGSGSHSRAGSSTYMASLRWGNANASLYDARENRCKTAVTAVYKDTDPQTGGPILMRSYDSRTEPPVEFDCSIWQAGRATCAIGLAFKPVRIGTSTFVDEGAGKYNPAPQMMDEAVLNEWPGRDIGVFVSVGTGKRPASANAQGKDWWEGFLGGNIGEFAEFRRTIIGKIEACEETHQYMRTEHLPRRRVNPESYYRINVDMRVGEFGMNEWNRVSDISTSTRLYLAKPETKALIESAASKIARIERAKRRFSSYGVEVDGQIHPALRDAPSPHDPLAVELPGDEGRQFQGSNRVPPRNSASNLMPDDKFTVLSPNDVPLSARRSNESRRMEDGASSNGSFIPSPLGPSPRRSRENVHYQGEAPPVPPQLPFPSPSEVEAPPRPPKTPIQTNTGYYQAHSPGSHHVSPITPQEMAQRQSIASSIASSLVSPQRTSAMVLPYPDDDRPPPVNMAGKPHYVPR